MQKSVLSGGFTCALLLFPLLSFIGCYSSIDAGDGSDEKAIAIDWVDPPCAEPGSEAGYIEGNGFGAENVTVTVGGIEAEVLAATGMDASFVVPEGLEPGPVVVVVENPGGRLATIDWRVCEIECDPPDCDDGDPCTDDSCDPIDGSCTYVNVCGDADPPELVDFDFSPKTVDVTNGSVDVTCTATVTDDLSGVDKLYCYIVSPSGAGSDCWAYAPSSGDVLDGVWSCPVTIPQNAEQGAWRVAGVRVDDAVGNVGWYYTPDLQNLGFPTQLDVTSAGPDTDPPVITDFDIAPAQVDVSTEAQVVTCTFAVQDIGVGLDYAHCHLRSPSGQTTGCSASPGLPGQTVSGDRFNGVFHCDAWIALGSEPGEWFVSSILAYDRVNNQSSYPTSEMQSLGFPTQLDVTSAGPDTDPPVITDFDIAPAQVDVSTEAQVVTCTFAVQDIGVGLDYAHCHLRSPSGQTTGCSASPGLPGQTVSGDRFNGVFHCDAWIALGSEPGEWFVSSILAYDRVNNQSSYPTSEMQSLGFPTQFEVTYGSGEPPP